MLKFIKNGILSLCNYYILDSKLKNIDKKLSEIKNYYSGKNKKYSYLEFIEKVSFNEDNIVDEIQNSLLDLRKELINIVHVLGFSQ